MSLRLSHIIAHPLLQKIGVGLLETLFPKSCLGCGASKDYLCTDCLTHLPRRLRQRCPTCRTATTPRGEVCFACSGLHALDGIFAATHYRSPLVAKAIHTYKYRFIATLAQPLGTWLANRVSEIDLPLPDLYIPVPLHPRRLRFRGFNQSALLAQALADTLTPGSVLPVLQDHLIRTRFTKPQMKTSSREERLGNLKNAFAISETSTASIHGKAVWLIDDIATTGTTLEECARALKAAGAKSVFGIVLAR